MGKASERRKARRQNYLAGLAATDPQRFQYEWNKRMDSWLDEAWKRTGKFINDDGDVVPPVFELVDNASRLLEECGVSENVLEDFCSIDVLINECCKAVSSHIDSRLYHLNVKLEKK